MQLGIHPARLTNIQQVYEDDVIDGFFYGENFNTYSKVYINDEEMETDFIDNNTFCLLYTSFHTKEILQNFLNI